MKSYMTKLCIMILVGMIACQSALGQYKPNAVYEPAAAPSGGSSRDFLPVSPTAGSLGIYGQIPVGNFTGTADIKVPIYELKYKELSVPISINYHASGNKPDLFPGPVGLGWALQAGGCISRVIKGKPDYEYTTASSPMGEESAPDPRPLPDWSSDGRLEGYLRNGLLIDNDKNDPDAFYFNINGYTGQFYLDHTDTFRIQSVQGASFLITMQLCENQSFGFPKLKQHKGIPSYHPYYNNTIKKSKMIYGFTMIDENGIKYTFGNITNSIEFSRPGLDADDPNYNQTDLIIPMSWYLTSIESPNGSRISFDYKRHTYVNKVRFVDIVIHGEDLISRFYHYFNSEKSTMINGCYLSSIKFPTGQIDFYTTLAYLQLNYPKVERPIVFMDPNNLIYFRNYSDVCQANTNKWILEGDESDPSAVDDSFCPLKYVTIKVKDKQNKMIQECELKYSTNIFDRLKLNKITIFGEGFTPNKSYKFEYDRKELRDYLHLQNDDYGYDNGVELDYKKLTDTTFINNSMKNPAYLTSLKKPSLNHSTAEMLNKIIYPTGGYTTFEYELHQYSSTFETWPFRVENNSGGNLDAGGVRIKRIENYDHTDKLLNTKSFHYVKDYLQGGTVSSGVLAYKPTYVENFSNMYIPTFGTFIAKFFRFSSNPVFPMTATRGNHVTYSEVTVEEDNGYSIYKYKNYDNGYADKELVNIRANRLSENKNGSGKSYDFYKDQEGISMALERGQLLSEEIYGTGMDLKKKVTFKYNDKEERFNENVRFTRCDKTIVESVFGADRKITSRVAVAGLHYTYFPYLKEKTEETFLNDVITQKTLYTYHEPFRLPKTETVIGSDSKQTIKTYVYNFERTSSNACYQEMVKRHMLAFPIEESLKKENYNIATVKRKFNWNLSTGNPDLILLENEERSIGTGSFEKVRSIPVYDSYGNPNQIVTPDNDKFCILWSYHGEHPVAKIEGLTYSQIYETLSEKFINELLDMNDPEESEIESVRSRLSSLGTNLFITTYKYKPLFGLIYERDPNGMKTGYFYDNFGRLMYVTDNDGNRTVIYEYHYKF